MYASSTISRGIIWKRDGRERNGGVLLNEDDTLSMSEIVGKLKDIIM